MVPEGCDDDDRDIYPEELTKEKRLSDKVLEKIKDYKGEIWDAITLIANLVIKIMLGKSG